MKATNVFAEEEVEYNLRQTMDIVEETLLKTPFLDGNPKVVLWQTPFYDIKVVFFALFEYCFVYVSFYLFCSSLGCVEFEGLACFL